jgi:hypothetical protein
MPIHVSLAHVIRPAVTPGAARVTRNRESIMTRPPHWTFAVGADSDMSPFIGCPLISVDRIRFQRLSGSEDMSGGEVDSITELANRPRAQLLPTYAA